MARLLALTLALAVSACAAAKAPREASLGTTNTLVLPAGTVAATYHYALADAAGELSVVVDLQGSNTQELELEVVTDGFTVKTGAKGTPTATGEGRARYAALLELAPGRKTASATVVVRRAGDELARDEFDFLLAPEGLRACRPDDVACGGEAPR